MMTIRSLHHGKANTLTNLVSTLCATYLKASKPFRIPYSNEASRPIRAYYNELLPRWCSELADIDGIVMRWHEQAWHLSVVQHAVLNGTNAHHTLCSPETAERSLGIVKWAAEEALLSLQPARDDRQIETLDKLIAFMQRRYDNGTVTLRELSRHGFAHGEVLGLAQTFPKQLAIENSIPGPNGGRPSQQLKVLSTDGSFFDHL